MQNVLRCLMLGVTVLARVCDADWTPWLRNCASPRRHRKCCRGLGSFGCCRAVDRESGQGRANDGADFGVSGRVFQASREGSSPWRRRSADSGPGGADVVG